MRSLKCRIHLIFTGEYVETIVPIILSQNGKSKKVLVVDCDNTLWKGILGEDGFDNIEMSSKTKYGKIFMEVQQLLKTYSNEGILIALCSKNNLNDVENVLMNHKDMILTEDYIVSKEINWNNKLENIKKISDVLNLNLDSFVFIDDSDFEINLVKTYLPQVKAIKVPENLNDYIQLMKNVKNLFYQNKFSNEDIKRTEKYKQRAKRIEYESQFSNVDEYLESLKQKIVINIDDHDCINRLSQITQKTNQFNLTTKRLTVSEIRNFMESSQYKVFSLSHSDQFGDSGITD